MVELGLRNALATVVEGGRRESQRESKPIGLVQ
jgi:hypothetical protein